MNDAAQTGTEVITLKPFPTELATRAQRMLAFANTIEVNSDEDYQTAAAEVRGFKGAWNSLESMREFFVKPLNDAVKRYNTLFKEPQKMLADAEQIVENKMLVYRRLQQKKAEQEQKEREEQQRKIREEAERKAREEQQRLEAEALRRREEEDRQRRERERQEREASEARERELEAKRRGDVEAQAKAKAEAEAADKARKEAEDNERKARLAAEQRELESQRRPQEVITAAQAAAAAPAAVRTTVPTAAGTSGRKKFKCKIVNKFEFLQAVLDAKAPMTLIEIDMGALDRMANAAKGGIAYPGVELEQVESLTFRGS
jgi:membrane protein involved in colicin uptake